MHTGETYIMGTSIYYVSRWDIYPHPATDTVTVRLFGKERHLFEASRRGYIESVSLPLIPHERERETLRRAMQASQGHWKMGLRVRFFDGFRRD
jgi:hypothetical protein